ncbi:hypothetical protein PMAYCL1PPCAC_00516, partial [Pristionchus mayeri]
IRSGSYPKEMSSTRRGNRPSKRDVIVIDDDDSAEQRAAKTAKIEEPEPVQQLIELQQKLKESEESHEKLTRIAGVHLTNEEQLKKRVEVLEKLIDSKEGIVGGSKKEQELEKRLNDLTKQLEEER